MVYYFKHSGHYCLLTAKLLVLKKKRLFTLVINKTNQILKVFSLLLNGKLIN